MLNNEEIVSFPYYLVVNHCNANDFELGEPFIVHLWLESVKYSMLFILINFQVEIPNSFMSKWLLRSKQWPFPLYFDIWHGNAYYFEWGNVCIINVSWMEFINVYFKYHIQYLSIGIHFTHFYCIGRRFGAFSPRVEIVIWELFWKES